MQCVILCAGKGTRMHPLTDTIPKPLIPVCGKPILDHVVEALPSEIDELVLVVGYLKEQIIDHCGDSFYGKKVSYVEQEDFAGGTGDALLCAKDLVKGKFLFMYADDIHGKEALREVVKHEHAMLGSYSDTPECFGVLVSNEDGTLKEIIERPENPSSNVVNIGGFVLDDSIFKYVSPTSHLGEVLATDMFTKYAADHPVKIVMQDLWVPIGNPEQLEEATKNLCL